MSVKSLSLSIILIMIPSLGLSEDKTCGHGPHILKVQHPAACENSTRCLLSEISDGVYAESCVTNTIACFDTVDETWSDWPECDGKRLEQSEITFGPMGGFKVDPSTGSWYAPGDVQCKDDRLNEFTDEDLEDLKNLLKSLNSPDL
jgi:hypothetical protein